MIPKAVADRLRKGITALETCQVLHRRSHVPWKPAGPWLFRFSEVRGQRGTETGRGCARARQANRLSPRRCSPT